MRDFEYRGRVVHLSRAPILAGFVGTGSRVDTFHSIRIDGVDNKIIKEMTIELDEAAPLDELEQLAEDYIDSLQLKGDQDA